MICVFKCPHCGSVMRFSPETQMLICDSCNSEILVSDYNEDNITYEGALTYDDSMRKLECPNCGSKIITETNTAIVKCSYCGDEMAAIGMNKDDIVPELIIPLSVTEKQALDYVIGWWLKHESMPELDIQKMKMEFHDIYIPVWLYDVDTVTTVNAVVNHDSVSANFDILGHNYKARRDSNWGMSYKDYNNNSLFTDKFLSPSYKEAIEVIAGIKSGNPDYGIPNKYMDATKSTSSVVFKMLESSFQKIPNVASAHFSGERFHGVEPYNYYGARPFKVAYLSGHQAENYEFGHEGLLPHIQTRVKKYALEQCYSHVEGTVPGGEISHVISESAVTYPEGVYYALVPLWICSYYYAGKKHYLYINGQTGKTDGEIIFNTGKYAKEVVTFGVLSAISWLLISIATGVALFDFANAAIYGIYILLYGVVSLAPKKDDPGSVYYAEISYFKNKKLNVKSKIITKLALTGIFLVINLLLYLNGFFRFGTLFDKMYVDMFLGLVIAAISTGKFALKRKRDMLVREVAEYKDYIVEAGTRVLCSARS